MRVRKHLPTSGANWLKCDTEKVLEEEMQTQRLLWLSSDCTVMRFLFNNKSTLQESNG